MMSMVRHPFSRQLKKVTRISLSHIQTETFHKDFCTSYFPEREAVKKVAKISKWQLDFLKRWQKVDQKDNHSFNRLHQTITGKSLRAHRHPSQKIIKLWIFTTIKPRFCVKISSQIVDPQNTTVHWQILSHLSYERVLYL